MLFRVSSGRFGAVRFGSSMVCCFLLFGLNLVTEVSVFLADNSGKMCLKLGQGYLDPQKMGQDEKMLRMLADILGV